MAERLIRIQNRLGLHARASAKLATAASRFGCEVTLAKDEIEVNAKSIMGIMMLAASQGTDMLIEVTGTDETEASEALVNLINNRFGEDE